MSFCVGDVVKSTNGRDGGGVFFVTAVDEQYAWIADGKGRRLEKPKKKKLKHLQFISDSTLSAGEKLRRGEKATNNELRRALSGLSLSSHEEQGGM